MSEDGKARVNEVRTKLQQRKDTLVQNCEPCGGVSLKPPQHRTFSSGKRNSTARQARFRIVGGTNSVKSRPWMAFLQILEDSRCGGTVVNRLFVLTAAHCMCTYFECKKDAVTGERTSDYDPSKDVKIFLGFKDLNQIFQLKKLSEVNENEYAAAKVVVHPRYNDALFDLALIKSAKEFKFGPAIQPICLPFGEDFPDVRSDAIVAGWGTLKNVECFTDEAGGPSPNSQCGFPFVHEGVVHQRCHTGPNPSSADPLCQQFREQNPSSLSSPKEEIQLFDNSSDSGVVSAIRSCYFPHPGLNGWCATCKLVSANLSDPHLCTTDRFEPYKTDPDENWGWCSKLCDDGIELLPLHLKEVTLVVFPPKKCRQMLNETSAPFGNDTELCAGFISKRQRKSFLVDESQGVRKLSFLGIPEKKGEFDLIGGKDACTGDSGGPLWIEMGKKTKRSFLVGVVSRGFNCASHNLPGIYVRVKAFLPWIMETSKEGVC